MARVRLAAHAALMFALVGSATAASVPDVPVDLAAGTALADVSWPPSSGLLVAEVVTGGASASDEYVEITNASAAPLDLAGLEVAYVTSSGATITRKAAWTTTLVLDPGRHLLIANALGSYASLADATYSGGLAATGGAVVLRAIGGAPLDAVGWGDATNAFVEGTAAASPPAGASIERRPGDLGGNVVDTNDNASDFLVDVAPVPQDLAADPVPAPAPPPSPSPTPSPTATPVPTTTPTPTPTPSAPPTPTPTPTPSPTATATPVPTPTPTPTPSAPPTPVPTPTPTPSAPPVPTPSAPPTPTPTAIPTPTLTPSPSSSSTPSPTPTPSPNPSATPPAVASTPILDARSLADGTSIQVEGVLTLALGSIESARGGYVQDETAGIALYLDAAATEPVPAGTHVRLSGVLDSRYAQRTLRITAAAVEVLGMVGLPDAVAVTTGAASEPYEGRRVAVGGVVTGTPEDLADGLGLMVDDGTGPVRVIAGATALAGERPAAGTTVIASGPLGQRDSSGTGLAGYRVFATLAGELTIVAPPSPTPSPTPAPTPAPSPTPTPTPSPTPAPSPSAPVASDIAAARGVPVGGECIVRGVVTGEAGRLGTPSLMAIGDATGGLPVRLPDGVTPPARGTLVEVRGKIADPYGQTELRIAAGGLTILGTAALPIPTLIQVGDANESTEGRLATIRGTITTSVAKATSGDLSFEVTGEDGAALRVLADRSAGLDAASLRKGLTATFTGIVGQRASRKGALDGYRLWVRDMADIAPAAEAPGASGSPVVIVPIADALRRDGEHVVVEGILTTGANLLDASGRRVIVADTTGAIEVYLAAPGVGLRTGLRVRVAGVVGRAYGAPRLRADDIVVLGTSRPVVRALAARPTASLEWQLVRVSGVIAEVHRLGSRWLAELDLNGVRIPISGLEGSGIAPASVDVGRRATVTGIVRRPYPTATDQRYQVLPRELADLVLGPVGPGHPGAIASGAPGGSGGGSAPAPGAASVVRDPSRIQDIDLVLLAAHAGQVVRVGGIVVALAADGLDLDDGTGTGHLVLTGDAAAVLALLEPGDALNAVGTAQLRDQPVLIVSDAADLVLAGDPGVPAAAASTMPSASPGAIERPAVRAAIGQGMGLDPAPAGLGTLLLLVGTSVLATLARRHRARRAVQARIVARLEQLGLGRTPGGDGTAG